MGQRGRPGLSPEQKRIIYSFGFAAKEHIAIAEKLLSEPPKERFDRVIVDKQVANRDRHLRNLQLAQPVRPAGAGDPAG